MIDRPLLFLSFRKTFLIALCVMGVSTSAFAQTAFDDPGRAAAGGGGDLKPVTDKVEAGEVVLGSSSQIVVLLRNDDSKPLKTGVINLYPSSNITATIGENQCAASPIAPAEVCAITVQVKGLQAGNFRIEMLVRHDGRTKLLTTTINGSVASSGDGNEDIVSDLEVVPKEIDFGTLNESRTQVKAVVLRNKTSKEIVIDSLELQAGNQTGYAVDSNCSKLGVGAACVASIMWSPQKKGLEAATVIAKHSGATGISTIELEGTYEPESSEKAEVFPEAVPGKGLLVSSEEIVDFGSGVAQSSSITMSLVNVGDTPLTLTGIRMANAENGVRVEKNGCAAGDLLGPMDACPLTMTWEPVREGSIVDDIQVAHTGARGILVMPIRGSATRAINKDSKAITLGSPGPEAIIKNIQPLSMDEILDGEEMDYAADEDGAADGGTKKPASKKPAQKQAFARDNNQVDESSMFPAPVDVRGLLDGYVITSFSANRAIVAGPGGSRVVFDGEETVIGGVLWKIKMRPNAIELGNGNQKVLLLFDKSLSSVNTVPTQSTGTGATTSTTSTPASTSSTTTTTQ